MESLVKSWSTFEVKALDDERRIITGIASTPSTDRAGDIVEPAGAKFTLPIPLLSQHDHDSPIGHVTKAVVTPAGIEIEASIPKDTGLGYVEKAWLQIKAGLTRGLSIGFRPLTYEPVAKGSSGLRFKTWEWFELSAVTIPANADASITSIKRYDESSDVAPESVDTQREEVREKAAAALQKSLAVIQHNPWSIK